MRYQIETWRGITEEGKKLFPLHYDELALHKEKIPLGMDFELYQSLEDKGILHVVTARDDDELVGYFIALVLKSHPHNKNAGPQSTTDMFWIRPDKRRGGAGAKLLMMAAKTLKERGVVKATLSTKRKFANKQLLEYLGWEHTDLVFQKIL